MPLPTLAETKLKNELSPVSPSGSSAEIHALLARLSEVARTTALEEMASGLAHELNQPLGAIATYSQAAERMLNKSPPMIEAAVEVMRQVSQEALNAGEGIKHIRRLFHRKALQKQRCSISALLLELQPLLTTLGERTGASLQLDIAANVPEAHADPLRIQHVLFTLIQNAFEADRGEGRELEVKVVVSSDRYSVEVAVIDNGSGIPAEAKGRIFRPFYTTKPSGIGLGLASSRAIIEMHEGTIGFDSSLEETRFWFFLPAFNEPQATNPGFQVAP